MKKNKDREALFEVVDKHDHPVTSFNFICT